MPMANKFSAFCVDCGRTVPVGDGLSEKKETLGLAGAGWLTKHRLCSFTPVRRVRLGGQYRRHEPELVTTYDDEYDDGFGGTMGMTESEFFGGDVGDKG